MSINIILFILAGGLVVAVIITIAILAMKNPWNLESTGEMAIKSKKWEKAIITYKKMLTNPKNKRNPTVYYNLAYAYEQRRHFDQAIKHYNFILQNGLQNKEITSMQVHKVLGMLYCKNKMHESALKLLLYVASADKTDPDVMFYIGRTYFETEQYAKAEKFFIACTRLQMSYKQGLLYLGMTEYKLLKSNEAIRDLEKSLQVDKVPDTRANNIIGKIYSERNDYRKAIPYFNKAIQANPAQWNNYLEIGICFDNLKETGRAIEYFKKALEHILSAKYSNDDIKELRYVLGNLYKKTGKLKQAMEQWEEIARIDPNYKGIGEKVNLLASIKKDDKLARFLSLSIPEFKEACTKIASYLHHEVMDITVIENDLIEVKTSVKTSTGAQNSIIFVERTVNNIGEFRIRDIVKKLSVDRVSKGVYITPAKFTTEALKFGESRSIYLLYGNDFKRILSNITI